LFLASALVESDDFFFAEATATARVAGEDVGQRGVELDTAVAAHTPSCIAALLVADLME
jgi:hypothetical protein